jgi:hypothetical protein
LQQNSSFFYLHINIDDSRRRDAPRRGSYGQRRAGRSQALTAGGRTRRQTMLSAQTRGERSEQATTNPMHDAGSSNAVLRRQVSAKGRELLEREQSEV